MTPRRVVLASALLAATAAALVVSCASPAAPRFEAEVKELRDGQWELWKLLLTSAGAGGVAAGAVEVVKRRAS